MSRIPLVARVRSALRRITTAIHVACGIPDYDAYVAHVRAHHPDVLPKPYSEFFRERQAARYGRGRSRCC
jgi:uncharacterized short protein YbdD (DUF466 family)